MAILDSQGRLFGKVSILDFGAALVILLVVVGILLFPGTSGSSIAQIGSTKAIEVDVVVRGLSVKDPQGLIAQFQKDKKINFVIRNQPSGQVGIKTVNVLPRTVVVPQPDGSVKALPDPRTDAFSTDMLLTLVGQGQQTKNGPVINNNKIKIGTPVQLEGLDYDFNASVIDVRV
jgi:hypothetical protein